MTDHRRELAAANRAGASAAERIYKARNPEAAHLKVLQKVVVYKPRPTGFADHAVRAVNLFLGDKAYVSKSNAEIAAFLCADFPGYTAPDNLLTERLSAIDKRKIRPLLAGRGIKINLDRANTPSKVKDALAAIYGAEEAAVRFKGTVAFTDDAVIVGTKRYPIIEGAYRRIHVGKAMLNVEGLRELFRPK